MKSYPDPTTALRDALRLAAGMTYKFAVPGMPYGGGKAVLATPPHLDPEARPDLLRRYGALVHQLGGSYRTAPDVGTSSEDMNVVAETGAPYVFARTEAAGGSGSSGPATALGVFTGIQVACEHIFGDADLAGRRVWVQGTGSVGGGLIEHLLEAGARVLFSEVDERAIRHFRDGLGLELVGNEDESAGGMTGASGAASVDAIATECDIFSPCALGGVLGQQPTCHTGG
jgi:glutamate dehydrogenase/leucine dehydrogenase